MKICNLPKIAQCYLYLTSENVVLTSENVVLTSENVVLASENVPPQ